MKEREIKAVPSQSDRHFQIRSDKIVVSFFISGVLRFQEQQVKISLIRFEKETSDRPPVSFCKIPPSTSLQLKRRKRTPSKKQSGSKKSSDPLVFYQKLPLNWTIFINIFFELHFYPFFHKKEPAPALFLRLDCPILFFFIFFRQLIFIARVIFFMRHFFTWNIKNTKIKHWMFHMEQNFAKFSLRSNKIFVFWSDLYLFMKRTERLQLFFVKTFNKAYAHSDALNLAKFLTLQDAF